MRLRAALCAAAVGVAVWAGGCGTAPLPAPGSAEYDEYASAFFKGLTAVIVDAPHIAVKELTRATQLVPGEPAGWADLGLLEVRQSHIPEAVGYLAKAAELAPESAAIAGLQGLAEVRRGGKEPAAAHYRRAVQLAPDSLKYRYAVVQALESVTTPEGLAESNTLVEEILARQPANLVVLLERVRLTANAGDTAKFQAAVGALKALAKGWPEQVQADLDELAQQKGGKESATQVLFVQQTLQQVPEYMEALAQLGGGPNVVGEPIVGFLKLAPAPVAPAAPDAQLGFALAQPGEACAAVSVMASASASGTAQVVAADAAKLAGTAHAFPGGGKAPGPAGLLPVDLDADLDLDLVLCGGAGLAVLKSDGKGGLVAGTTQAGAWYGAWAADVELDGDLDLVVGALAGDTVVLQNAGDGKLEAVAGHAFAAVKSARDLAWGDLDGEGTPDVALVDADGKLAVFLNQRAGRYKPVEAPAGKATAVAVADTDADGRTELLVLAADGAIQRHALKSAGGWESASAGKGPAGGARLIAADLDNNGALDLVAAGADSTVVLLGDGKGFSPLAAPALAELAVHAVADLDRDGFLDLAGRTRAGKSATAKTAGKAGYHWIDLRPRRNPEAKDDKRINSFGVGGEMQVRSGLLVQKQVIQGPVVHFGMGARKQAEAVRTLWPNGAPDGEFELAVDGSIESQQRLKGSCPWVFTNNGREMVFVTDFLWRSPLGLRINGADTAGVVQTEDRVKIRGDQLVAAGGQYDVRITAELWETHFVDHLALLVVDHAPDTEVFVDERFSPAAPPVLDVRAMTRPVPVARATDDRGRDVTVDVAARDERFLDVGRGDYQGITRDHWVELPAPAAGQDWLVAHGWIQPTDSSLNVAIAQAGVVPRGLSLEAREANGSWSVLAGDLGFPAGKNKTVLVPVGGAAGRPLRLRSNLEIYWDQLAYASASAAAPVVQRVPPASAILRHRGYSRTTRASRAAPELPDYADLWGTAPRWRDLEGFHTRFGDVMELVRGVDDRYVIMNAGDELALRFAEVPAVAGRARDYVLLGDGWEKDGDFNTAASRTVLPLPSHDWPAYDRPAGPLSADPVYLRHAADWRKYHTRYVTPARFARGLFLESQ